MLAMRFSSWRWVLSGAFFLFLGEDLFGFQGFPEALKSAFQKGNHSGNAQMASRIEATVALFPDAFNSEQHRLEAVKMEKLQENVPFAGLNLFLNGVR